MMEARRTSRLRLRAVTGARPATAALKDGTVTPTGIDLEFVEVDPLPRAFRAMVRDLAFDVCEMAFATYLCARDRGRPFTALPIILVRDFHHAAIVVAEGSGLVPKDLEGRRVGVNRGYTVTGGVWARGVLAAEHGVDLARVCWAPSGDEHVAEYNPPPNVRALDAGGDLAALISGGTLDAAVGIRASGNGLEPLIPDPDAAAFAALAERGHYPINHLLVVRNDHLAAHPHLPAALFEAYVEAKRRYLRGPLTPQHERIAEIVGSDPLPYGIEPNRGAIDELLDHAIEQRILERRPAVEQLFAPGSLDLLE